MHKQAARKAGSLRSWHHKGIPSDIIAYLPILDADTKPEPPAWSGDGLPPVGCEFEFSVNGRCWEERVMLFNDGITCLMAHRKYPANRWHYKSDDPALQFRPLRSEEDGAVEEIRNVVAKHAEVSFGMAEALATWLYRAGYRKTGGE